MRLGVHERYLETRFEGEVDGYVTSWGTLEGDLLGSHFPPRVSIDPRTVRGSYVRVEHKNIKLLVRASLWDC